MHSGVLTRRSESGAASVLLLRATEDKARTPVMCVSPWAWAPVALPAHVILKTGSRGDSAACWQRQHTGCHELCTCVRPSPKLEHIPHAWRGVCVCVCTRVTDRTTFLAPTGSKMSPTLRDKGNAFSSHRQGALSGCQYLALSLLCLWSDHMGPCDSLGTVSGSYTLTPQTSSFPQMEKTDIIFPVVEIKRSGVIKSQVTSPGYLVQAN